jgi:uncharacterized phiE125 gp8 family phage protein
LRYVVTLEPAAEPVTLADAKVHVKALPGDTGEDASLLRPLIATARQYCENVTGRALAAQTIAAYPADWAEAALPLPKPPITAVSGVTYYDADGGAHALDAEDYALDAVGGRLMILRAPEAALRAYNPIEIAYTAGYSTTPFPLRQAMLLLIAHWYVNREAVAVGAVTSAEIDLGVRHLCRQYKVRWY